MDDNYQLVEEYIKETRTYSEALKSGNSRKANKLGERKNEIEKDIIAKGLISEMLPFLEDDDEGVRFCIASSLIKKFPNQCVPVLKKINSKHGPFRGYSLMVLDIWEKGKL